MAKRTRLLAPGDNRDLFEGLEGHLESKEHYEDCLASDVEVQVAALVDPKGSNAVSIRGKGTFEIPYDVAYLLLMLTQQNYGLYTRAAGLGHHTYQEDYSNDHRLVVDGEERDLSLSKSKPLKSRRSKGSTKLPTRRVKLK